MPPTAAAGSCAFPKPLPCAGTRCGGLLLGFAWEPLSSCITPEGLKSGRLLSNLVYCCFTAFQKVMSFQKAAWNSYLTWSWEQAGVCTTTPACSQLSWSHCTLEHPLDEQLQATSTCQGSACCFFSWPGSNLHWKGTKELAA